MVLHKLLYHHVGSVRAVVVDYEDLVDDVLDSQCGRGTVDVPVEFGDDTGQGVLTTIDRDDDRDGLPCNHRAGVRGHCVSPDMCRVTRRLERARDRG